MSLMKKMMFGQIQKSGLCLSRLERYEEAIERINRALEIEDEEKDTGYI